MKNSVMIKSSPHGILVVLNDEISFQELCEDVALKFQESAHFFKDAKVALSFEGRELSSDEETQMLQVISDNSNINVLCVLSNDDEKEQQYQQALTSLNNNDNFKEGQFYKGILRSGQVLESESSIVILGDVNPGAKLITKGNAVILGTLKGNVYAGASGDSGAFVIALDMDPMQIKIGDVIARSSDKPFFSKGKRWKKGSSYEPKIAFVEEGNIYIEPITKEVIDEINFMNI